MKKSILSVLFLCTPLISGEAVQTTDAPLRCRQCISTSADCANPALAGVAGDYPLCGQSNKFAACTEALDLVEMPCGAAYKEPNDGTLVYMVWNDNTETCEYCSECTGECASIPVPPPPAVPDTTPQPPPQPTDPETTPQPAPKTTLPQPPPPQPTNPAPAPAPSQCRPCISSCVGKANGVWELCGQPNYFANCWDGALYVQQCQQGWNSDYTGLVTLIYNDNTRDCQSESECPPESAPAYGGEKGMANAYEMEESEGASAEWYVFVGGMCLGLLIALLCGLGVFGYKRWSTLKIANERTVKNLATNQVRIEQDRPQIITQ